MTEALVCPGCGASDALSSKGNGQYECGWCHRSFVVQSNSAPGVAAAPATTAPAMPSEIKLVAQRSQCVICGRSDNLRACTVCGELHCGFHRSNRQGRDVCDTCWAKMQPEQRPSGSKAGLIIAIIVIVVLVLIGLAVFS